MSKFKKKVVILNAPASAGKDVTAEALCHRYHSYHHKEFKKSLFDIAKAVAQISDDEWDMLYTRELKEVKTDRLFGRSPREHMIHTSESLIKPVYGKEYFGEALALSLEEGVNIVSDGGFEEELKPVIDMVGEENVLIIRLHREGCTFDGDSRNYLDIDGILTIDVFNDGTLEELFDRVEDLIYNSLIKPSFK